MQLQPRVPLHHKTWVWLPADSHIHTSQQSISYAPAPMLLHSLGSASWNMTKPISSLMFPLLFVTLQAALKSQLYSFLYLLL